MNGLRVAVLLGVVLMSSAVAQAANRIEGTVTYYSNGHYEVAPYSSITIVDAATNRVVSQTSANSQGSYTAFVGTGRFEIRARYGTLRGANCCVNFRSDGQKVRGVNVAVR